MTPTPPPAQAAALIARRLSFALDRAAYGRASRDEVEAEFNQLTTELDKWRKA